jgi:RNA polymerase sigma factor (TIGR02999 family)
MSVDAPQDITGLLRAWSQGDQAALERLIPLVDGELHRIARRCLDRKGLHATLDTTSLVNEAYLRLMDVKQVSWSDRAHFLALGASIMRGILVDHARAHLSAKRGRGAQPVSLDEAAVASAERTSDLVAIDDALSELSRLDPRRGRVVELRFFGGMSVEETAEVLGISAATVMRDWTVARLWLMRELTRGAVP